MGQVECGPCSRAGGAERAVFHEEPACRDERSTPTAEALTAERLAQLHDFTMRGLVSVTQSELLLIIEQAQQVDAERAAHAKCDAALEAKDHAWLEVQAQRDAALTAQGKAEGERDRRQEIVEAYGKVLVLIGERLPGVDARIRGSQDETAVASAERIASEIDMALTAVTAERDEARRELAQVESEPAQWRDECILRGKELEAARDNIATVRYELNEARTSYCKASQERNAAKAQRDAVTALVERLGTALRAIQDIIDPFGLQIIDDPDASHAIDAIDQIIDDSRVATADLSPLLALRVAERRVVEAARERRRLQAIVPTGNASYTQWRGALGVAIKAEDEAFSALDALTAAREVK